MTDNPTPHDAVQEPTAPAADSTSPTGSKSPVAAMFGRIVNVYDPLNRLFSLGLDQHWRDCLVRTALLGLHDTPLPSLLDSAAGTLDVSLKLAAARPDARITALDFCLPMLEKGQKKLGGPGHITPVAGDALRLPLPDQSMHALTMAFGIRNISPRETALAEMVRVLKPGGRACLLEFSPPEKTVVRGLYGFYLNRLLPLVGKLLSKDSAYKYLAESITTFPTPGELAKEMRAAGFDRVYHVPLTFGVIRLHVGEKA